MMRAVFHGDSFSDSTANGLRSGLYADMLCAVQGWQRVGQTPGDPDRAAIAGTLLTASAAVPAVQNADAGVSSFARRVLAHDPNVLIVEFGCNDYTYMAAGLTPATWAAAWESYWSCVLTLPAMLLPVIVLGLPGSLSTALPLPGWAYDAEWLRAEMDHITRNSALAHNCIFVPLAGMDANHVRPDGHPNPKGHGYIGGAILAALGVP